MEKKNATNVSHVITLLPLRVCKTAHSEGETMKVNKVIKILRCDSSLQLDQIVKLIPTDEKIHQFNECVKLSHLPIIFAGMKEIILERNPTKVFNMVKPLFITVVYKCVK